MEAAATETNHTDRADTTRAPVDQATDGQITRTAVVSRVEATATAQAQATAQAHGLTHDSMADTAMVAVPRGSNKRTKRMKLIFSRHLKESF